MKIRSDKSYLLGPLLAIGTMIYLEIYLIKYWIEKGKLRIGFGKVFLIVFMSLICIYYIFGIVDLGRTVELTRKGCIISFFIIKCFYSWNEYQVKKIERYSKNSNLSSPVTGYDEGAVFSKVPVKRPKRYRPANEKSFLTPYVFSTVWICFRNEKSKDKNKYWNGFYEVDKEEFLQKMDEWGIELEKPE